MLGREDLRSSFRSRQYLRVPRQSTVQALITQMRRTQRDGLMTRTACWSGKLKYFGSDACELVEARAGVSGQQDPAGGGGRGGYHHVVC